MSAWSSRTTDENRTACWLGLDGTRKGWSVSLLTEDHALKVFLLRRLNEIQSLEREYEIRGMAIDMPFALASQAERGGRECDRAARRTLARCKANVSSIAARKDTVGPSSIFTPPSRLALDAFRDGATHAQVSKANADSVATAADRTGLGISIQSYNIMPKIVEAEDFVRSANRFVFQPVQPSPPSTTNTALFECHPELAFLALKSRQCDRAIADVKGLKSKKTLQGRQERCELLSRELDNVHVELCTDQPSAVIQSLWRQTTWRMSDYGTSECLSIATDDLLDSLACVLAAKRFTDNPSDVTSFPAELQHEHYDEHGVPMAIFV